MACGVMSHEGHMQRQHRSQAGEAWEEVGRRASLLSPARRFEFRKADQEEPLEAGLVGSREDRRMQKNKTKIKFRMRRLEARRGHACPWVNVA